MSDRPDFNRSADTRFIIQKLRPLRVGEQISYAELAAAVSRPVGEIDGSLASARRALLREDSMVFGTVRGVGLRRLSDTDIVRTSAAVTKRIRRAARRGVRVLAAVNDFSALPRDDQMRHSASVSVLAAIAEMTTDKSLRKIESVTKEAVRELPFAQTLAAFRDGPEQGA
jgi:hypothetical protein